MGAAGTAAGTAGRTAGVGYAWGDCQTAQGAELAAGAREEAETCWPLGAAAALPLEERMLAEDAAARAAAWVAFLAGIAIPGKMACHAGPAVLKHQVAALVVQLCAGV